MEVVGEVIALLRLGREGRQAELVEEEASLGLGYLALKIDVVVEVMPRLIRLGALGVVSARVPPEGQRAEDVDGGSGVLLSQAAYAIVEPAALGRAPRLVEVVGLGVVLRRARLAVVGIVVGAGPEDVDVVLAGTVHLVLNGALQAGEAVSSVAIVGVVLVIFL